MTGQDLREQARDWCVDALRQVPADAPTLCEGWTAHDLAIHLWTLDRDPLSWPATAIGALSAWGARRADRVRRRFSYSQLVAELADGRSSFACMPEDALEGGRHALGEWFVHGADVRRANGLADPEPSPAMQDALWRRAVVAGWWLHGPRRGGIALRWPVGGRAARIDTAPVRQRVVGEPSELLLWVHGRTSAARVELLP